MARSTKFILATITFLVAVVFASVWMRPDTEPVDEPQTHAMAPQTERADTLERQVVESESGPATAPLPPPSAEPATAALPPPSSEPAPSSPQQAAPQSAVVSAMLANNDLNGDGVITREEAEVTKRSLLNMWNVYDLNEDNKIDAQELEEVSSLLTSNRVEPPRAAAIISSNDLNGDGIVTREEAKTANKALHLLWDIYDLNRDGSIDALEAAKASDSR